MDFHGVRRVVDVEGMWNKYKTNEPARLSYAIFVEDVLKTPDEVWGNWDKDDKPGLVYFKKVAYPGHEAFMLVAVDYTEAGMKVRSFYPVRASEVKRKRWGILLYRPT